MISDTFCLWILPLYFFLCYLLVNYDWLCKTMCSLHLHSMLHVQALEQIKCNSLLFWWRHRGEAMRSRRLLIPSSIKAHRRRQGERRSMRKSTVVTHTRRWVYTQKQRRACSRALPLGMHLSGSQGNTVHASRRKMGHNTSTNAVHGIRRQYSTGLGWCTLTTKSNLCTLSR